MKKILKKNLKFTFSLINVIFIKYFKKKEGNDELIYSTEMNDPVITYKNADYYVNKVIKFINQ